MCATHS
ncbi:unnamed protein product [Linum tenue]|nr:unnamed protein product [Linum tenue]